ncbi:MAG: hypothetical protein EP315_02825 [Gammaproteobacteria bacterium]|nr:MAG: hypothetical protein EP315_02825 [Gammaproteobacteria bacterium]
MKAVIAIIFSLLISACSHTPSAPLPRAQQVNLHDFMGDWYVIANIPTFLEKGAHNAIESYALQEDGTIATTFRFNQDSYDGELKVYTPTGFVSEEDNSLWGMQFIWPIKAEFVIAYLSTDYQHTIIARSARDYLWIMSRSPAVPESILQDLIQRSAAMGYDPSKIQRVPHQIHSQPQQTTPAPGDTP